MTEQRTSTPGPTTVLARAFNMVEIVLALGVVAIGVVSIMALFPVAANASRDAMAETYACNAADHVLHYLEHQIRIKTATVDGWDNYIVNAVTATHIPAAEPSAADKTDFTPAYAANTTLYPKPSTAGVYKVIRFVDGSAGTDDLYEPANDIMDFEAVLAVWQEAVTIPGGSGPVALDATFAVALHAEISWPAKLPYERRQKSLYHSEIFKR